eukprot:Skav209036  [mRNA]  locus=scaffold2483:33643:35733:- [translate_table: standard]
MNRDGAGCSSWLACNVLDHGLDPELRAVFQRVMVWQRFARLFPEEMDQLHQQCCEIQSRPRLHTKPGPVAAFVAGLIQLGARFLQTPFTFVLEGWAVNWLQIGKKPLLRLLEDAWVKVVCGKCTTRKNFNIPTFDVSGNCKMFAQLPYEDRAYIESMVIGKHYTGDFLSKFLPAVSPSCPVCGAADSRSHRVFDCPAGKPFRNAARMKRIAAWEEPYWFYSLCPPTPCFQQMLQRFTAGYITRSVPTDDDVLHHVFTDGTAFFGDEPKMTMAAGAYVEVEYLRCRIISDGGDPVPGIEQHSFVGEIHAVYLALSKFWHVNIYTDCQGLCDLLEDILHNRRPTIYHSQFHTQLWQTVVWMLQQRPPGTVRVVKVKAHVAVTDGLDDFNKWLAWGNNTADERAKHVILHDWRSVYNQIERAYKRCQVNRADLQHLWTLVIRVNKACAETSICATRAQRKHYKVDFSVPAFAFPLKARTRVPLLDLPRELLLAFPWGPIYLWRLIQWSNCLVWKPPGTGVHVGDIAFVELLVDFVLFTGTWPPRNVSSQAQRNSNYGFGEYVLDDVTAAADVQALPLASHSNIWKRSLLWLMKYLPGMMIHGQVVRKTESLALLGCPAWHEGLDSRPRLACQLRAAETLSAYYVTQYGCKRNMDRVLQVDVPQPKPFPAALDVPFKSRLSAIRTAKDTFTAYVTDRRLV